ncbi:hypothetical protein C8J56DRAFT_926209 [Mycena floridula]|nr:hypothetical protein C8J56DRAFT_926209 [Mycena floridula]
MIQALSSASLVNSPAPLTTRRRVQLKKPSAISLGSLPRAVSTQLLESVGLDNSIPQDFIRTSLALHGQSLFKDLCHVQANIPDPSVLPSRVEVTMSDTVQCPPTHMLAVYSRRACRTEVKLFPTHGLIIAAHCSNIPELPASESNETLPVVSLHLPCMALFPTLHAYLYTKNLSALLASLRSSQMIIAMYLNAMALGVVDEPLYEALNKAWTVRSRL